MKQQPVGPADNSATFLKVEDDSFLDVTTESLSVYIFIMNEINWFGFAFAGTTRLSAQATVPSPGDCDRNPEAGLGAVGFRLSFKMLQ